MFLTNSELSAQSLEAKAIQMRDLPANTLALDMGYLNDFQEVSHPLHQDDAPNSPFRVQGGSKTLYGYSDIYEFTAFIPDKQVFIANWLYTYDSVDQAKQAAELIIHEISKANSASIQKFDTVAKDMKGQTLQVQNSEGNTVYWFIGVDNNILSLAMADGLDDKNTAEVFKNALHTTTNTP